MEANEDPSILRAPDLTPRFPTPIPKTVLLKIDRSQIPIHPAPELPMSTRSSEEVSDCHCEAVRLFRQQANQQMRDLHTPQGQARVRRISMVRMALNYPYYLAQEIERVERMKQDLTTVLYQALHQMGMEFIIPTHRLANLMNATLKADHDVIPAVPRDRIQLEPVSRVLLRYRADPQGRHSTFCLVSHYAMETDHQLVADVTLLHLLNRRRQGHFINHQEGDQGDQASLPNQDHPSIMTRTRYTTNTSNEEAHRLGFQSGLEIAGQGIKRYSLRKTLNLKHAAYVSERFTLNSPRTANIEGIPVQLDHVQAITWIIVPAKIQVFDTFNQVLQEYHVNMFLQF